MARDELEQSKIEELKREKAVLAALRLMETRKFDYDDVFDYLALARALAALTNQQTISFLSKKDIAEIVDILDFKWDEAKDGKLEFDGD